jgi:transcriptional regulator with XRE-family HTH domain
MTGRYEGRQRMREDQRMARFTPPTPRSRRLGREIRRLREARNWTLDHAGAVVGCSGSRIGRIETGDIKPRPRDVLEILVAYEEALDGEPGKSLLEMARELREVGWWQRQSSLPSKFQTFLAYEEEALEVKNFEPTLVPGLLQTEAYARAVLSVDPQASADTVEQRVKARMKRQELLTRAKKPLRLHAIVSEAALLVEVGSPEVMREQLLHIVETARRTHVTVQILRFAAGAHMADHGGFVIMSFEEGLPLGYIDTLGGSLFLEAPDDIGRLVTVYDHLRELALSPAESARHIKGKVDEMA